MLYLWIQYFRIYLIFASISHIFLFQASKFEWIQLYIWEKKEIFEETCFSHVTKVIFINLSSYLPIKEASLHIIFFWNFPIYSARAK